MSKKRNAASKKNLQTFADYRNRLSEIAMNMFEWHGLPDTIDQRFLQKMLYERGRVVFFVDEVLGLVCLPVHFDGGFDVYGNPVEREAYSPFTNYHRRLTPENSVIVWNNYKHEPSFPTINLYAERLAKLERTIDVNVNAQKTPVTIVCDERQVLTMKNFYAQYEGNEPMIIGDKGLDISQFKVLNTQAPYVADKLQIQKRNIWYEALSYLGVENNNTMKAEREVSPEVEANQGPVEAQRYIRLNAQRDGAKEITNKFADFLNGETITVDYRSSIGTLVKGDTTFDVIDEKNGNLLVTDGGEVK